MSEQYTVKLKTKTKENEENGDLMIEVGAELGIEFQDAETTFKFGYTTPDELVVEIEGKATLVNLSENRKIIVGAGFSHDFINEDTTVDGTIELVLDKKVSLEVNGSYGTDGSSIGVGLSMKF